MTTTRRISAPSLAPATIEIQTVEIDIPPGFGDLPQGHDFGGGWSLAIGYGLGEHRDIVGHGVRLGVPWGRGGTYFQGPVEVCVYPLDPATDPYAPQSRDLVQALASATEVAEAVKATASASGEAALALAGLASILKGAAKAAKEAVHG